MQVRQTGDSPSTSYADNVSVTAECSGTEKLDPGWLGVLYRPTVPTTKDSKVRATACRAGHASQAPRAHKEACKQLGHAIKPPRGVGGHKPCSLNAQKQTACASAAAP